MEISHTGVGVRNLQFTALVPLKKDSRRLPNKNLLKLAGKPMAYHIFDALLKVEKVEKVCLFSSSKEFMGHIPSGVEFIERDPQLDQDSVRGLDLLRAFAEAVPSEYFILAHATSPFLTSASLQKGVDGILGGKYDSALSVSEIKKYFWYENHPINYNINDIVQTQYIQPVQIETSGFYMFSRDDILVKSRRIGENPLLVTVNQIEGLDIDDYEEFETARRFQDLLVNPQTPTAGHDGGSAQNHPVHGTGIKLALFELEGVLSGSDGVLTDQTAAWLGILARQGTKIGVMGRMDQEQLAGMLAKLSIDAELIPTSGDPMAEADAAELALETCRKNGISPGQSAYVGASSHGYKAAESAGMVYLHAGWSGQPGPKPEVPSFENISEAAIHILELGRW